MDKQLVALPKPKIKTQTDTKSGKMRQYFHIRLIFPFEDKYGTKRPPKDVYSSISAKDCTAKAQAIIEEYKPLMPGGFRETLLIKFIEHVYFGYEEGRTIIPRADGGITFAHFYDRKQRLIRYLLDPASTLIRDCSLRRKKLENITPADIRNYFEVLKQSKTSPRMIMFMKGDLRQVLAQCIDDLSFPRAQLFDGIKIPKMSAKPVAIHDINHLMKVIPDETMPLMWRILVFFAFETMCRPSEQFALTWNDIDFDNGTVTFNKAMRKTSDGYEVSADTKRGKDSNRTIPVSKDLLLMLRTLQKQMKYQRRHVFASNTGSQLNMDNFAKVWSQIKRELKFPKGCPSFYKLKHTGNSWLQSKQVSITAIKERIGHSPKSVLAETTYAGATPEQNQHLLANGLFTEVHQNTRSEGKSGVKLVIKSIKKFAKK